LPGDHASTYGGNPLACAAGNAVMSAFEEQALLDNVKQRGEQLRVGLEALGAETGVIKEVRGWGLIMGVELTESCGFLAADVVAKLMEAGMLTVPAATLAPPFHRRSDDLSRSWRQWRPCGTQRDLGARGMRRVDPCAADEHD